MVLSPKFTHLPRFKVSGITVRTITSDEFNPETAKLAAHWGRFYSENIAAQIPQSIEPAVVYGVYSNYASDLHGQYDVTAGVKVAEESQQKASVFNSIEIHEGNYLVFTGKGAMPQTVIQLWQQVWQFFDENPDISRQYLTDFEVYRGADEAAVYIGVKEKQ